VVAPLRLPLVEVLELKGGVDAVPEWMVIPSISKLASSRILCGLPSIDEMSIGNCTQPWGDAAEKMPSTEDHLRYGSM